MRVPNVEDLLVEQVVLLGVLAVAVAAGVRIRLWLGVDRVVVVGAVSRKIKSW
jgi:hypothetical protein